MVIGTGRLFYTLRSPGACFGHHFLRQPVNQWPVAHMLDHRFALAVVHPALLSCGEYFPSNVMLSCLCPIWNCLHHLEFRWWTTHYGRACVHMSELALDGPSLSLVWFWPTLEPPPYDSPVVPLRVAFILSMKSPGSIPMDR